MTQPSPGGTPAFDPMNLTEGIASSGDEILEFREKVYELAAHHRTTGHYPEKLM
jgi:hypothetical protein